MTTLQQALSAASNAEVTVDTPWSETNLNITVNPSPVVSGLNDGWLIVKGAGANPATESYPTTITNKNHDIAIAGNKLILYGFRLDGQITFNVADLCIAACVGEYTLNRATIQTADPHHNQPTPFIMFGAERPRIYAVTTRNCADGFVFGKTGGHTLDMRGCHGQRPYPSRTDDRWHTDWIACVAGGLVGTVADSEFDGQEVPGDGSHRGGGPQLEARAVPPTDNGKGPIDVTFTRFWGHHSSDSNIALTGRGSGAGATARVDSSVLLWSANNGVDIVRVGSPTSIVGSFTASAPPGGATPPWQSWRAANLQSIADVKVLLGIAAAPSRGAFAKALGVSPGNLPLHYSNSQLVSTLTNDLKTYGLTMRTEIRMNQTGLVNVSSGWWPGASWTQKKAGFDSRYATEIGYFVNAAVSRPKVVLSDFYRPYTYNADGRDYWPTHANQAKIEEFVADLARYLTEKFPTAQDRWIEVSNEPNNTLLNGSSQPDHTEYNFWLPVICDAIHTSGFAVKVLGAAPAPSDTFKLVGDGWTSKVAGWDSVHSPGTRRYAPIDWNWLTRNAEAGKIDGKAHHCYWQKDPCSTGLAGSDPRGVAFPTIPDTYPQNDYVFQHVRDMKDFHEFLVQTGALRSRSLIHCTELGIGTAEDWSAGKTYPANVDVFEQAYTYNAGSRTGTRRQRYRSLQNGNTGHTPSSSPTWWAPTSANYTDSAGNAVAHEDEAAHNLEDILRTIRGDILDPDGCDISGRTNAGGGRRIVDTIDWFLHMDSGVGDGTEYAKGLRLFDGTEKTGGGAKSILDTLVAYGALADPRAAPIDGVNRPPGGCSPVFVDNITTSTVDIHVGSPADPGFPANVTHVRARTRRVSDDVSLATDTLNSPTLATPGAVVRFTIDGLPQSTDCYSIVDASNNNGVTWGATVRVDFRTASPALVPPGPPSDYAEVFVDTDSIAFGYRTPLNVGSPPTLTHVRGRLYAGPNGAGQPLQTITVAAPGGGAGNIASVFGFGSLNPTATYSIAVDVSNTNGFTFGPVWTPLPTFTTSAPPPADRPPGKMTVFAVNDDTAGQVTYTYQKPTDPGIINGDGTIGTVNLYRITRSYNPTPVTDAASPLTETGLTPTATGTLETATIAASNNGGSTWGAESDPVEFFIIDPTPPDLPPVPPGKPSAAAGPAGTHTAIVGWAYANGADPGISQQRVTCSDGRVFFAAAGTTSLTTTGHAFGVAITFTVAARRSTTQYGAESPASDPVVPADIPPPQPRVPAVPSVFGVATGTPLLGHFYVLPPDDQGHPVPVDLFRLTVDRGAIVQTAAPAGPFHVAVLDVALTAGPHDYTWEASNNGGLTWSLPTAITPFTIQDEPPVGGTDLDPPATISASVAGIDNAALVTWADDGDPLTATQRVTWSTGGTLVVGPNVTSITIAPLAAAAVFFTVARAGDDGVYGSESVHSNTVTPTDPPPPPPVTGFLWSRVGRAKAGG